MRLVIEVEIVPLVCVSDQVNIIYLDYYIAVTEDRADIHACVHVE